MNLILRNNCNPPNFSLGFQFLRFKRQLNPDSHTSLLFLQTPFIKQKKSSSSLKLLLLGSHIFMQADLTLTDSILIPFGRSWCSLTICTCFYPSQSSWQVTGPEQWTPDKNHTFELTPGAFSCPLFFAIVTVEVKRWGGMSHKRKNSMPTTANIERMGFLRQWMYRDFFWPDFLSHFEWLKKLTFFKFWNLSLLTQRNYILTNRPHFKDGENKFIGNYTICQSKG